MNHSHRARWGVALGALLLTAMVGCGEDDKSSPELDDAGLGGEPVKFSVLYPKTGPSAAPSVYEGAKAAAQAINDDGGIQPADGGDARPIELVECDADNSKSPSQPAECAKEVLDEGVVLDVAKYTLAGDEVDVFQEAGLAMLGVQPFSQQDLTSPMSFPISGAAATLVPATAAALQANGAETVAYLSLDIPAAHAAADFIAPILEGPDDLVETVLLPTDQSADPAPYLAKLAEADPDGIILGVPGGMMAQVVTGLRQAGYDGEFVATPFSLPAETIEALGADAEGMLSVSDFASPFSTDSEAMDQFNAEMDEYAPDAERNEHALNAWASVHLAAEIAETLETIDVESFAGALDGYPVDLGIAPAFTLGQQDIYLPFERVFRATVQYQSVVDGEIVATGDGEFIDLNTLAE